MYKISHYYKFSLVFDVRFWIFSYKYGTSVSYLLVLKAPY